MSSAHKYVGIVKNNWKLTLRTWLDDLDAKKDKTKFPYDGIHIYYGWQGSGKTASIVFHAKKVVALYPRALITSNLSLKWLKPRSIQLTAEQQVEVAAASPRAAEAKQASFLSANLARVLAHIDPRSEYIQFEAADELSTLLHGVRQGTKGHLLVIDEIHLYLNSLKSKDTSIETFAAISQLRKNKTLIIGSSQVVMRLEKAVREQMTTIIKCDTHFGVFTMQTVFDGHTLEQDMQGKLLGDVLKRGFFVQNRELRESYDTLQIVQPSNVLYEQRIGIEMKQ